MGNVVIGANGIAIRQGIYEESSVQKTDLGRFIDFEDGRRFRYCKNGTVALTIGVMTMAPAIVGNHKDVVQTAYGLSIGQKVVNVLLTTTAPTAGQYNDGFLLCGKGTGLGQLYRIKKHTLDISPCVITLYDPIIAAVPAASELTITPNKRNGVLVAATTPYGTPTGIPLIGVTASYYFWAQTRGYAPFLSDSTITTAFVIGEPIGDGETKTVAGSMDGLENQNNAVYGICVQIPEVSEYGIIDLQLE
jgi:hypothetical protein